MDVCLGAHPWMCGKASSCHSEGLGAPEAMYFHSMHRSLHNCSQRQPLQLLPITLHDAQITLQTAWQGGGMQTICQVGWDEQTCQVGFIYGCVSGHAASTFRGRSNGRRSRHESCMLDFGCPVVSIHPGAYLSSGRLATLQKRRWKVGVGLYKGTRGEVCMENPGLLSAPLFNNSKIVQATRKVFCDMAGKVRKSPCSKQPLFRTAPVSNGVRLQPVLIVIFRSP
jgi:hypothetical protein